MIVRAVVAASARRVPSIAARRLLSTVRDEHNRFHDRRDIAFCLHEVEADSVADKDALAAVLDMCEKYVEQHHHIDPILDQHGPTLIPASQTADGRATVTTHEQTKVFYKAFTEQGLPQLPEMGLSFAEQCAASFMLGGAFSSNAIGYFVLTRCAADLLEAHGSDELKQTYLAKLKSAEWMGTMALSEPQSGSSLAGIRTVATPYEGPDAKAGEYRIKGSKMWTSGAFHDLTGGHICHMLLARIAGDETPPGNRGISLFLVPNMLEDTDGVTRKNDVDVVSLNKKMGHHALSNCAWNLGDQGEGAVGYLIGKPHQGLACMFRMMNAMRIEVGLGAAALGKRGLQESLLYAQEREQGGARIIEYSDVKRMLLLQKAYAEGSFALCLFGASLQDKAMNGDQPSAALLDTLTEVIKSWPSEWCLEANKLAIQVLGGAGYVHDYPVEQLYRDNRLNMIHEGTAGIHATTLLNRKMKGDKAKILLKAMRATIDEAEAAAGHSGEVQSKEAAAVLTECATSMREAAARLEEVTTVLNSDERKGLNKLVNAHDYLTLVGHTVAGWMWLRMARAAAEHAADGEDAASLFYRGKLHTCQFFCRHELPKTKGLAELLTSTDMSVDEMRASWF